MRGGGNICQKSGGNRAASELVTSPKTGNMQKREGIRCSNRHCAIHLAEIQGNVLWQFISRIQFDNNATLFKRSKAFEMYLCGNISLIFDSHKFDFQKWGVEGGGGGLPTLENRDSCKNSRILARIAHFGEGGCLPTSENRDFSIREFCHKFSSPEARAPVTPTIPPGGLLWRRNRGRRKSHSAAWSVTTTRTTS